MAEVAAAGVAAAWKTATHEPRATRLAASLSTLLLIRSTRLFFGSKASGTRLGRYALFLDASAAIAICVQLLVVLGASFLAHIAEPCQ